MLYFDNKKRILIFILKWIKFFIFLARKGLLQVYRKMRLVEGLWTIGKIKKNQNGCLKTKNRRLHLLCDEEQPWITYKTNKRESFSIHHPRNIYRVNGFWYNKLFIPCCNIISKKHFCHSVYLYSFSCSFFEGFVHSCSLIIN